MNDVFKEVYISSLKTVILYPIIKATKATNTKATNTKATKTTMNTNAATIAANKAKMEASIAKMKASFKAIEDAKTHAVVLDTPAPKAVAGSVKKTVVYKAPAKKIDQTTKPAVNVSTAPVAIRPEIIAPTKKVASKPKSKLSKLVKGKTVFDFTR